MKVITERKIKTRKPHKCWGCTQAIPIGTECETSVSEDMGQVSTSYWCKTCDDFLKTLDRSELQDGFAFGDLLEYDNYPRPATSINQGEKK